MATIGADVDADIKERFRQAALARNWSASRLAAVLIAKFLEFEQQGHLVASPPALLLPATPLPPPAIRSERKTEQVFVRLEPYYYAELERLAQARLWHRSTYLANLLYAHVDRRPVFCEEEINALRQVTRQLADMGRNINQIARKLNSSLDQFHQAQAVELDLVKMLIDLEISTVKNLIRANVYGWGMDTPETTE